MGRMDGQKRVQSFKPHVRLVSMTDNPIGTLFAVWYGSRNRNVHSAGDYECIYNKVPFEDDGTWTYQNIIQQINQAKQDIVEAYPEYAGEEKDPIQVIKKTVEFLLDSDLPPLESVVFTFEVDDVAIAWRDQLVRDRRATYWTQTSRTMDLRTMDVNINESIERLGGSEAVDIYKSCVETIRDTYDKLMSLGVPSEDIRLNPPSMIQRDYWTITLRQLMKVLKKRTDWIAQATMWHPVISDLLKCLPDYISNMLKDKCCRPNVKVELIDGEYKVTDHHYDIENYDRYVGKDPQPCDPLWLAYRGYKMPEMTYQQQEHFYYLKSLYKNLWPIEYLKVLGWDDYGKPTPYDPE